VLYFEPIVAPSAIRRPARLIPVPETYEEDLRARHLDLQETSAGRLRAERHLLASQAAGIVWTRQRRGYVWIGSRPIPILTWLHERIRRIDAELAERERQG